MRRVLLIRNVILTEEVWLFGLPTPFTLHGVGNKCRGWLCLGCFVTAPPLGWGNSNHPIYFLHTTAIINVLASGCISGRSYTLCIAITRFPSTSWQMGTLIHQPSLSSWLHQETSQGRGYHGSANIWQAGTGRQEDRIMPNSLPNMPLR